MAQPIRAANSYPREALGLASAARGNEGMLRTSAPEMYNREDSGPMSMSDVNPQSFNNARMELQNIQQNVVSQVPQAEASAIQEVRNNVRRGSQQEFDAVSKMEEYKASVLSQMPNTATNAMADPRTTAAVEKSVLETRRQEPFAIASANPQHSLKYNSNSLPGM